MKKKYKKAGSILLTTIIAAIIWVFIAQCMFITSTSGFSMLKSSREALQAQQYAEITIDKLKNVDYDQLDSHGAHSRQQIKGISSSDWQDEVKIGSEAAIDGSDGAKQRIATVNVYKKGDTVPRCTLEVPLSSSSQGGIKTEHGGKVIIFPDGTMLQSGFIPITPNAGQDFNVIYPVPFKQYVIPVATPTGNTSLSWDHVAVFLNSNLNGFTYRTGITYINGYMQGINWIAIGK